MPGVTSAAVITLANDVGNQRPHHPDIAVDDDGTSHVEFPVKGDVELLIGKGETARITTSEYQVQVSLPRDGRRLLRFTKRRELKVGGLERNDVGRIVVHAIGAAAMPGRAKKAKLRPLRRPRGGRSGR